MSSTIETDDFVPQPGWPCNLAPDTPAPAIDDILSNPDAATILPQVLALTPRGGAWGTDEAGDGQGASPVQRQFWTAIAAWAAADYAADFDVLRQAFPSMVTWSLQDWAAEYTVPDPCSGDDVSDAQLLSQLRTQYAAIGAGSPDYLICVAAAIGYPIEIEEFRALRSGFRCGDRCYGELWESAFRVHAPPVTQVPMRSGFHAGDRIMNWGNATLECAIRAATQPQNHPIFAYDLGDGGGDPFTLDDGTGGGGDPLSL